MLDDAELDAMNEATVTAAQFIATPNRLNPLPGFWLIIFHSAIWSQRVPVTSRRVRGE